MRRRALLSAVPLALPAAALSACGSAGTQGSAATDGSGPTGTGSGSASAPATSPPASSTARPSASSADAQANDRIAERLDALDLPGQAGQLVWVGVSAGGGVPRAAFAEHRAGGMFLLGRWESARVVRKTVAEARAAAREAASQVGLLVVADQEGGQVRMLRGDAVRRAPSAARLGARGAAAVREAYAGIGKDLAALGIDVDLAPVADVVEESLGRANKPVGGLDRGFGTDPAAVAACVRAAVEGLHGAGVAAALKHFPGLGRVRENTDFSAEGTEDAHTHASDPVLAPFHEGLAAGAAMVMLSSARYRRLDAEVPAMFSRAVVTDLLRGRLGHGGLVITDDIGAARAVAQVPVGERAVSVLEAGGDAMLTARPELARPLTEAIIAWGRRSEAHAARVRQSAQRVLTVKDAHGLLA